MIRHIFIGTFKEGISDEIKIQEVTDMKAMKEKIPGIVAQELKHPYHTEYIDKTGDMYFDRKTFVVTQFEF